MVIATAASMLWLRTVLALFEQIMGLTRKVLPAVQVLCNLCDFNDRKDPNITSFAIILLLMLYQINNH